MRNRLTGSTAVRLTGFVALIVTLTNIIVFTAVYIAMSGQMMAHLRAHIDEVRKTFVDVEGGKRTRFDQLAEMVENHARVAQSDEDIYLLTDEKGNRIAGNVESVDRFDGWRILPWSELKLLGDWPSHRTSDSVVGRWTAIEGGYLFIGDGNGDIKEAQRLVLTGLIWGIVLSVFCAILGGWLLGRQAQRRVREMEKALDAVAGGALDRRVPRGSTSDDIDHVAALVNVTLDRLQRLFTNLQQVTVDIAHDLRTPISRMRQQLETVRSGADDLDAYKSAADNSIQEIDNIAETFDALLRISEIEAGARKNQFVDVELNPLIANIVDAVEAVAEERHHRLQRIQTNGQPMIVRGDRRLLNQLFINLLENAIVHCPLPAEITIETDISRGNPVVRVRDTGPGIPEDEREKVFRRLYRLEKSRTTAGNGLGLSLVAAIAELHSAKITLGDNAPGLVAEVTFFQS